MSEAITRYRFGAISRARLATCHIDLQLVMNRAIITSPIDFSIICGHRNQLEQNAAFNAGLSKVMWPNGAHNHSPSRAVDIAPYPIDWQDYQRFLDLNKHVMKTANDLGVHIRWGGDWDRDGKSRYDGDKDEKFVDLPHYEMVGYK